MASQDPWADYEHFVTYFVPKQTMPKLRMFGEQFNRYAGMSIQSKSSDRKGDLVEKIRSAFSTLKRGNRTSEYLIIRRECEKIASGTNATSVMPAPTFGGVPSSSSFAGPSRLPTMGAYASGAATGWMSQPQFGGTGQYQNNYGQQRAATSMGPALADWKASPLWKPVRALTGLEPLPDITPTESSHTRKERRAHFTLPNDVIDLLKKSKGDPRSRPVYSVRLFCTSSEWYRPAGLPPLQGVPPPTNRQIPIEFPNNPDVAVDDSSVPFKERGLRGKAGSAPPLDLDKSHRGLILLAGRLTTIIMGHTGPTLTKRKEIAKRFWYQVVFCEMTPVDDLLTKLEALAPTDATAELAKLRRQQDDDDIQVALSHLSLKDPLSGMRITKPIRSSKCTHLQCFDARWWLEANKTHPQWLCPHCSKELVFSDIICDGYFLSIINTVSDEYEEVVLEANGEWHTADKKYGSLAWMAENGASREQTPKRPRPASMDQLPSKAKRTMIEILSDSDDSDKLSNDGTNGHANSAAEVIDLTIDSDSDDNNDGGHDTDDEEPLRFRKPVVQSTSRGVAGSQVRPAEPPVHDATQRLGPAYSPIMLRVPSLPIATSEAQTRSSQPPQASQPSHASQGSHLVQPQPQPRPQPLPPRQSPPHEPALTFTGGSAPSSQVRTVLSPERGGHDKSPPEINRVAFSDVLRTILDSGPRSRTANAGPNAGAGPSIIPPAQQPSIARTYPGQSNGHH